MHSAPTSTSSGSEVAESSPRLRASTEKSRPSVFWPLRRPVRVLFGPPVDVARFRKSQTQPAALVNATDVLMADISKLLAQLRDEPAPATRWNPADHGQKETGRLES